MCSLLTWPMLFNNTKWCRVGLLSFLSISTVYCLCCGNSDGWCWLTLHTKLFFFWMSKSVEEQKKWCDMISQNCFFSLYSSMKSMTWLSKQPAAEAVVYSVTEKREALHLIKYTYHSENRLLHRNREDWLALLLNRWLDDTDLCSSGWTHHLQVLSWVSVGGEVKGQERLSSA